LKEDSTLKAVKEAVAIFHLQFLRWAWLVLAPSTCAGWQVQVWGRNSLEDN
jgi:hypothetical protein